MRQGSYYSKFKSKPRIMSSLNQTSGIATDTVGGPSVRIPSPASIEAAAHGFFPTFNAAPQPAEATAAATAAANTGGLSLVPVPRAGDLQFAVPMEYPFYSTRTEGRFASVFGSTLQGGFVSILYAILEHPLEIWEKQVRSGSIRRLIDPDIRSKAIELINSTNPMTTFITTPIQASWTLGIRLPVIVLVLKNLQRYFAFDVQIIDDTRTRRRFRARYSGEGVTTTPSSTALPLRLSDGWNQVSMNLAHLTNRIYGTRYVETIRVQVYANIRMRRIFFCDKLYGNQELAADFRAFVANSSVRK